jgi:hypothetical protein
MSPPEALITHLEAEKLAGRVSLNIDVTKEGILRCFSLLICGVLTT